MKVLIVDDSAVIRERLVTMLSEIKDVEITGQAQSPREAMEVMEKQKPDAVILDIRIHGGSGIDVLRDIKRNKQFPMVIMLSNYPYSQYRKRCKALGADFFFDKSTEFEKVAEVLEVAASIRPQVSRMGRIPKRRFESGEENP